MADSLYDQFQVSISNYVDLTQKNSSETQKVISQQGAAAQDIANLLKEIGTTQVIQKQSEVAATLTAQERNLATARSAGVDPEKGVNKINDAIALQAAEQEKLVTSLQELNRIDNLGISDLLADPLGTLKAKVFDRSGVESKVAQSAALTKVLHSNVQEIAQTMNSSFQVNAAIKQTMTAASADAAVRAVNLASQIQVKDAEIKAFNYNLVGIEQAQKTRGDILGAQAQGLQAQTAQTNLGLAIKSARRAEQAFSLEQQIRNDELNERKENRAAFELTLAKYNRGAQLVGKPTITAGEFKAKREMWGKGGMEDDSILYQIGSQAGSSYEGGMFGNDAAAALDTVKKLNLQLGPEAEVTVKLLKAAEAKLATEKAPNYQDTPANKESRAQYINEFVKKQLNGYSNRAVLPGDKNNPLNFGSLANRFELPEFASVPLVKNILAPLAASGADIEQPNMLFSAVAKAVADKKIDGAEAAKQLRQIVKTSYNMNYEAKQLGRLGNLKVDKPQYKIQVDMVDPKSLQGRENAVGKITSYFGGSGYDEVDLLDETSITHALARKLAYEWKK